jgi:hypothetical protein
LHVPDNFPTRVPWSSIGNDSDDFLLQYKYLFGVRGVAPKDYTVAHNGVDVGNRLFFVFLLVMNILHISEHSMLKIFF